MKKIGNDIERLVLSLAGNSDQARINLRARQVRERYRKALELVYKSTAELFLDHTNNVYIMKKEDIPTLIVYVDESIYAAELNAQRELIKLKLLELFGEQVENFEIHVSRGKYKNYHPYVDEDAAPQRVHSLPSLSKNDREVVSQTGEKVEDPRLRRSFEKAMTADLARKMTENGNC